ncbi:MAG: transglycosylase SLT domain-containing protein [Rhodobacteraceae bacterium]|nr:transglycosylase SLT domain-containing protein [Paracoccaceae bacterium]MCY4196262.1 transglycosylase SLT domain-containing protein [Paracoccaceae bacterium]MCY4328136.1 transglycosylase SLT domain-containing protein [Paracoccaceae bacterium]
MFRRLLLVVVLAACSVADWNPPANLDDACSIIQQKPKWYFEMRNVERRWDLPISVQMAILWQESKFSANAKTPRTQLFGFIPWKRQSSAYGFAQVVDGTWDWYKKKTGKRFVSRANFGDAVEFMGWYSDISTRQNGIAKSDVRNQYLAYHEGHAGYKRRSYERKRWLVEVADKLVSREDMYRRQLRSCVL